MEKETKMRGTFTVIKVGGHKAGKGGRPGMLKCFVNTLSARVKDLFQRLMFFKGHPFP